MTSLEFARLLETSLDQASGRSVHVADMGIPDERPKDELDLWAFVRVIFELSVVEQWV
jgi:hypothetical protein